MSESHSNDSLRVSDVAGAIADGNTLDWTVVEARARHGEERSLLSALRVISRIAALQDVDADRSDAASPSGAPQRWGSLYVLDKVGAGQFGDVYRAWDPVLDRDVALKILRRPQNVADEDTVVQEGRLMARVRHPNVVTIYGAQRIDGRVGLWMEFVHGRTLDAELKERGLFEPRELARIGADLASALAAVHAAGLVHRDVKAQNVMREDGGRVVLGDFGTGRAIATPVNDGMVGTPAYLAPEIFRGEAATPQSDLYSLGALLFLLATSRHAVAAPSIRELEASHLSTVTPPSIRRLRPDMPRPLADVIEKALNGDPNLRFGSATDMADALRSACDTRVWQRRVASFLAVAGVLTLMMTAGLLLHGALSRPMPPPSVAQAGREAVARQDAVPPPTPADPPPAANPVAAPPTAALAAPEPDKATLAVAVPPVSRPSASASPARRAWVRSTATTLSHIDTNFNGRDVRIYTATPTSNIVTCTIAGRQAVALCDLDQRTIRDLRTPGNNERAAMPVMSGDGQRVVYMWQNPAGWSVRVIDVDGKNDRELLAPEANVILLGLQWVQGSEAVAVLRRGVAPGEQWVRYDLVPAAGGPPQTMWTFAKLPEFSNADVSPDGRFIAFDELTGPNNRDLAVVDVARQRQTIVLAAPSNDIKPKWTPDGSAILYQSDGNGVRGLYLLDVVDGKAIGEPSLVRDITRGTMNPVGFAGDGSLLVQRLPQWYNTYRATVDFDGGVVETPRWLDPRSATDETPGVSVSPDGRYIAYVAGNLDDPTSAPARIVVLRADGTLEREMRMRGNLGRKSRVRWSPDNRRVAAISSVNQRIALEVFDAITGQTLPVVPAPGAWDLKWDPTSDAIYFGSGNEIRRVDVATGVTVTVYRSVGGLSELGTFDVSLRDGSLLVPVRAGPGTQVRVVTPDGRERIKHTFAGESMALAWTPDGRRIVASTLQDRKRATLIFLDDDGDALPRVVRVQAEPIVDLSFDHSGELFFAAGNPLLEYWTLSGFLARN